MEAPGSMWTQNTVNQELRVSSVESHGSLWNLAKPYRGGGPAIADLLGGQVDVTFAVVPTAIEYIRAGRLRALAVTSATPQDALPNVPPIADFLPGYEAIGWWGLFAPQQISAAVIDSSTRRLIQPSTIPK